MMKNMVTLWNWFLTSSQALTDRNLKFGSNRVVAEAS